MKLDNRGKGEGENERGKEEGEEMGEGEWERIEWEEPWLCHVLVDGKVGGPWRRLVCHSRSPLASGNDIISS